MKYNDIVKGKFISRPNRFVAEVEIDGQIESVHVKNTGRCQELLLEGVDVILQPAANKERKTRYDLVAVYRDEYGWINIDSQAPNQLVKDWLENNDYLKDITYVKPEYKYGDSRIDFYFEQNEVKSLMEVKGCTLIKLGMGYFPDAPTDRGVKHLHELTAAVKDGYNCYIAFVIQVNNVDYVLPNRETQPEFAVALRDAIKAGVKVLFLGCNVSEDGLEINRYKVRTHL